MPKDIRGSKHITSGPFGARAFAAAFLLATALATSGCLSRPPAPAGTARFDLAADPRTLNPLFSNPDAASVELQVARLSFEPFVDFDARGRPVPALLRTVPTESNGGISQDGRTIRYELRPRVFWSDGRPVTAADVLFTLHAILDPRNPVRSHEGYDLIDRAYAPNAQSVIVHLRRAWAPAALSLFSYGVAPQFVLPAHVLQTEESLAHGAFNAAPSVGDGPYRFVSWRRGEGLQYVANPHYWRGKPPVAELSIRTIPDPSTNLLLLQSGELDWNLLAPAQIAIVRRNPQIGFVKVPTAVVAGLAINTQHPPLDDTAIRRALAMSIDRGSIAAKITLGLYPVTNMIQPQFSWAFDPAIREPDYDPPGADKLFDAAGWRRGPDGLRRRGASVLRLVYVQFPESTTGVRVATAVQAALRARGVDLVVKSVSNAQLFLPQSGVLATGAFDLAYVPWTMGGDPDDSAVLACGAASNYMRWCNASVDRLERQALDTNERAARKRLYGEIARIVAHDVPILYLFNADYVYAYRKRLHGFVPNAFLPTWNAFAWRLAR